MSKGKIKMELIHTIKYKAVKTTVGKICADYDILKRMNFQFYDTKDDSITWMEERGVSNWAWMQCQNKARTMYILEEISDEKMFIHNLEEKTK
jgi:aminoglycoside phosphotransferase (APT) family kinase protein